MVGREASNGPVLDERVGGERRSCLVSYRDFLLCITPLFDTRAFAVCDRAFARTTPGIGDDPAIVHVHNPCARKVTWPWLSSARGVAGIPLRGKPTHMQRDTRGQQKGSKAPHDLDQATCGTPAFASCQCDNHGITKHQHTLAKIARPTRKTIYSITQRTTLQHIDVLLTLPLTAPYKLPRPLQQLRRNFVPITPRRRTPFRIRLDDRTDRPDLHARLLPSAAEAIGRTETPPLAEPTRVGNDRRIPPRDHGA